MNNSIVMEQTKKSAPKKRTNGRDVYSSEIMPLFNREGWFYRTATAGFFATTEPNSADVYIMAPKPFVVEIKTAHEGVLGLGTEGGWRQGQIDWADKFEQLTGLSYWLAAIFETEDTPHKSMLRKSSGKGKLPRAAFLVPFEIALLTKEGLPQSSLPYLAKKHYSIEMQENKLDACHIWSDFVLDWNGKWVIPETHCFYQQYLATTTRTPSKETI